MKITSYFLENNSLFDSIYGKSIVGKIKDFFTVIFSEHVIRLTLYLMFGLC